MAVWFMDGFDHYCDFPFATPPAAGLADFLRKWSSSSGLAGQFIGAGFARQQPGQGLKLQSSWSAAKTRPGSNTDTFIVGFAFQWSLANVAMTLLTFLDGATEQVSVRTDVSGHLLFNRGATNLATSTNVLSANTWYYLECKTKVHGSAGTYEVRINGTATNWIPAATGKNTQSTANAQITGFQVQNSGGSGIVYIDDLYAADTTGSANTDFLGPQMIFVSRPMAAGNYAQWTPNFGANFGNVNEIFPDGDATFNQDSTAGHIDSFLMSDVPIASGTITAIQHVIYAKQDSGAQRTIASVQRESTTDYVGANVNLTTSYLYYLEVKDVDPATSAAYTINNFNGAEFGYKLIA